MDSMVVITWKDHCSLRDCHFRCINDAMALEPPVIKSMGFVIKETDEYVVIVAGMDEAAENREIYGDHLIIKSCIVSRINLVEQ